MLIDTPLTRRSQGRFLVFPGLDQHLDGHVAGNVTALDELPADFIFRLAGGREEHLHAAPEKKVILNLPTTVENCMPNQFADMLEYFIRKLPGRAWRCSSTAWQISTA